MIKYIWSIVKLGEESKGLRAYIDKIELFQD